MAVVFVWQIQANIGVNSPCVDDQLNVRDREKRERREEETKEGRKKKRML